MSKPGPSRAMATGCDGEIISLLFLEPGIHPCVRSPVEIGTDPKASCKAPLTIEACRAFAVLGPSVNQAR